MASVHAALVFRVPAKVLRPCGRRIGNGTNLGIRVWTSGEARSISGQSCRRVGEILQVGPATCSSIENGFLFCRRLHVDIMTSRVPTRRYLNSLLFDTTSPVQPRGCLFRIVRYVANEIVDGPRSGLQRR